MLRFFTLVLLVATLSMGSTFAQRTAKTGAQLEGLSPTMLRLPAVAPSRAAGDTIAYLGFDGNDLVDTTATAGAFSVGFFDEDNATLATALQPNFGTSSGWFTFSSVLAPGDTNRFVGIFSWHANTSIDADNWLVLGPIVVPPNGAEFSWVHQYEDNGFRDGYEVLIGDQGGTPADFLNATALGTLADNDPFTDGDTLFTQYSVDVEGPIYGGDTIYLAIHHNASDQFIVYFDDLTVTEGTPTIVQQPCSDLFFSEYIEGSSSNKAFEIYNPTGSAVDLSDYQVHRFNNGNNTNPDTLQLTGMLMDGDVYVVGNPSADAAILAVSDTLDDATFYNGDDALVLLNVATGDTLDIIGIVGVDPGSSWTVGSGATRENTLVRMTSVQNGTTDWSLSSTQWLVFPQNTFDSLGSHTMMPCGGVPTPICNEIFFSEYVEGSSNNKALEVYNPTLGMVDLNDYQIHRFNNGNNTNPDTFQLNGMLPSGGVYVIANPSADPGIANVQDTSGSATFYNGDDALVLLNVATGDTADIIGVVGVDPGSAWTVGAGETREFTLVRADTVTGGTSDWSLSSTQWLVFPQNTFDSLGAHYSQSCAQLQPPANPIVSFGADATVSEGVGTASVQISITGSGADTVAVDVSLDASSTATNGMDFNFADTTVVFPANATQPITLTVPIIDDMMVEGDETIVWTLSNATNGATFGDSAITVTIEDNDFNYPAYSIGLVTADNDNDGIGDSVGVRMELTGTVIGIDIQGGSNIQFTFVDGTGGVALFSNDDYGYTVNEGDSVTVRGTLTEFRGLTQMSPDTIILVATNTQVPEPAVVTTLDESTESELVVLECVKLVDPTEWSPGGGSDNIDVTNGVDTFTMRIDSDVNLNDKATPPAGYFDLTGIGGQFSFASPALDGYQILPRDSMDLVELPDPSVSFVVASDSVTETDGTITIELTVDNANPDSTIIMVSDAGTGSATAGDDYNFVSTRVVADPGCKTSSTVSFAVAIENDTIAESRETLDLVIAMVTNGEVTGTDTFTVEILDDDMVSNDRLLPTGVVTIAPNPASDLLRVQSTILVDRVRVFDLLGRELLRRDANTRSLGLDISSLPAGTYLLRAETREGVAVQRWVKQ